MASGTIQDVYDPLRFATKTQERQWESNNLIQSGVMVANSELATLCGQSGWGGDIDNIKPLPTGEPSYTNDNTNDKLEPKSLGNQVLKYQKAARAESWGLMDLAKGIGLQDPMIGVTNRLGDFWASDVEKRVIHSMQGIMLANVAQYGSSLVHDVSNDSATPATASEKMSALNFIKGLELHGDRLNSIAAIGMHSTVYYGLMALELIATERPSADVSFQTFQGKRVIVDNSLITVQGANRIKFTSILFGAGAVEAGEGNMKGTVASEMWRDPSAGNGGGEMRLFSRRTDIIMPVGCSFEPVTLSGQSASYAELATAANWKQVWDEKNIPFAFIITNG